MLRKDLRRPPAFPLADGQAPHNQEVKANAELQEAWLMLKGTPPECQSAKTGRAVWGFLVPLLFGLYEETTIKSPVDLYAKGTVTSVTHNKIT